MQSNFKISLLKEAESRISSKKGNSHIFADGIPDDLLKEATDRVNKFKKASLQKEAMAQQQGVKDLRNSTANTRWSIPAPTARIQQIHDATEAAFKPYFYGRGEHGAKTEINVGAYFPQNDEIVPLPNEKKVYSNEPDATVRMEFRYKREIVPIQEDFKENATEAIDVIERVLPGFKDFIKDLDGMHIPLMPFFHQTMRSKDKGGGFTQSEIRDFISKEAEKYNRLPDNHPFKSMGAGKNFYSGHMSRYLDGEAFPITDSFPHDRRYDRSYVFDISTQSVLIRAIKEKIQQGYCIDYDSLFNDIMERRNKLIRLHKYTNPKTRKQQIRQKLNNYKKFFDNYFYQIQGVFSSALEPIPENENSSNYDVWGTNPATQKPMRGLKIRNKKTELKMRTKHMFSTDLTTEQLKLALYHMTTHVPEKAQKAAVAGPEDFVVPNNKMVYSSNGWDSMPNNPEDIMPLMSSIRRNRAGEIIYDHDQVNLGRHHLVKNGKAIEELLSKWGEKCTNWLQTLTDPSEVSLSEFYKEQSSNFHVPIDAWSNVIGNSNRFGNRTNAETLLETIEKYPDWQSFYSNILNASIAGERDDTKTPGVGAIKKTDSATMISPESFEVLKRFGYATSKIMDFASAVMFRSCEEGISSKSDTGETNTEWFFGRTYTTSQGKAEYGQVVIGVRYAFNAKALGSQDVNLKKIVDKHRGHHHIRKPTDENPEIMRKTRWWQQGTEAPQELQPNQISRPEVPTMRVMENMSFWIGTAASQSRFLKSIDQELPSWQDAISVIQTQFPSIEGNLGVIFEPMHANLNSLSIASKKALAKIVDEIRAQQAEVEIVFIDKDNKMQVLDAGLVEAESLINDENNRIDREENGIYETGPSESQPTSTQPVNQNLQPQTTIPGNVQTAPMSPVPPVAPAISTAPQNIPVEDPSFQPQPGQVTETTGPSLQRNKKKPMRSEFISRKTPQTLIRNGPDPFTSKIRKSSLIEKLVKVSDKLDKCGSFNLSNKIDKFVKKLIKAK